MTLRLPFNYRHREPGFGIPVAALYERRTLISLAALKRSGVETP
ncbi:MAG: hypothetical protein ABSC18_06340 [Verrucomicrobiota bacterium]